MSKEKILRRFPESKIDEYNAYLRITMKSLNTDEGAFSKFGSIYSGYIDKTVKVGSTIISAFTSGTSTELTKNINDVLNRSKEAKDIGLTTGEDIMIFETYIPAGFGISLTGDWAVTEMMSTEKILSSVIKGGSSLFGQSAGNFVSNQYTLLKNELESKSNMTLTPLEIKQFRPSFLDTTLDFDFRPQSRKESELIMQVVKALKQGLIPNSKNGEWYDYPALFDIEVVIKGSDNGVAMVSNKNKDSTDLFTNFKSLGMTSFNMTSDSGNNVDMKVREDGSLPIYKLSMGFTSTTKYFEKDTNESKNTVKKRVNSILGVE